MNITPLIRMGRMDPITETDNYGVAMLIGWRRKEGSRKRGEFMLKKPTVWIDRQKITDGKAMTPGCQIVINERSRRLHFCGQNDAFEDQHTAGELAACALCYLTEPDGRDMVMIGVIGGETSVPRAWPLDAALWRAYEDRRSDLAAAGALYLAEASRLKRAGKTDEAVMMEGHAMGCAKMIDDIYRVGPLSSGPWMMQPTAGGEN